MIEIFFFSFLSSLYYISAGIFFSKNILNLEINYELNVFKYSLYGGIILAFLALFLNFFLSLGKNINTIIFLFFLIYLLVNQKKLLKKIFISSIIIALTCCILIIYENTYRPDAGLYHLPYISILNNEKLIIGLSNIHFRYAHTSIIQYLSALNYNWIFSDKGIVLPIAMIYSSFLFYLIYEMKNTKDKNILVFNFLLFSFLCLKINRYSDFGNDAPAHIYYFFLTSLALKYFSNINQIKMGEIITISSFIVFNKITLFLGSLITFIFLFFKKKIYYFKIKPIIFVFIFTIAFFLKNFFVSGCMAFPIDMTCTSNVIWFDHSGANSSMAKTVMIENEAWTKGWSDQKKRIKSYDEYISNFDWINIWLNNHGKRTFIKLLPFIIFLIFFSTIILKIKKNFNNENNNYSNILEKKILSSFLLLNLFGVILWFLKFPVFRYGYSYIILFIIFLILFGLNNSIKLIEIKKLKSIISYLGIFLICILFSKNFIRIKNNFSEEYISAPWPKIYSYSKTNKKLVYKKIKKNGEFLFYLSDRDLCMYGPSPCAHFFPKNLKIKKKFGYNVYWKSKEN